MVKRCFINVMGALLIAAAPFSVSAQSSNSAIQRDAVEPSYATALIRDVLIAVNQGNWTGNYTVLRDYASADFAQANDPTRLAGLFTSLRAERLDLLPVLVTDPVLLKTDMTTDAAQMRLTGYFPLQPRHISFDLTLQRDGSRWSLTGISVGAFDPIKPEDKIPPSP